MNDSTLFADKWNPPAVPATIAHGDMPGDKICVNEEHIAKAQTVFPLLQELLTKKLSPHPQKRAVVSVCGGSGVGKSELASVLGYYLHEMGLNSYIFSGDNYPHRIPRDNDLERVRIYRTGGLRGLVDSGCYTNTMGAELRELWDSELDADKEQVLNRPWLAVYQQAGKRALKGYLGTPNEIDFDEVNGIIARFKRGDKEISLKRMGRETTELWYENTDFSNVQVLIIEWTHGNSDFLQGIDVPVLLNSTPAETLAHRRARNRDGKTDSAFTNLVLEIEQKKLEGQAEKAKIILSKSGKIISYAAYRSMMAEA